MLKNLQKSLSLAERTDKLKLVGLLAVNVSASVLETVSLGLVYLLFAVAMQPGIAGTSHWLQRLTYLVGPHNFMLALIGLVAAVFIARTSLQGFGAWLTLWLRRQLQMHVSVRLFNGYIEAPYDQHLFMSSSKLLNNCTSNTAAAVAQCTLGLVEIGSAALLVVLFLLTMFIARPVETVVAVGVLAVVSGLYWMFLYARLANWGARMVRAIERSYAAVADVVAGLKTIKVAGVEPFFETRFADLMNEQTSLAMINGLIHQFPRLALELLIVVSVLLMMALSLVSGQSMAQIIPTLALFGMAALRMVPGVVRIVNGLQLYRNSLPSLEAVVPDFRKYAGKDRGVGKRDIASQPMSLQNEIVLTNVSYTYQQATDAVVRDIDIRIDKGTLLGFVGLSGSGKTTTADIILGLLEPTEGQVLLDGKPRVSGGASGLFSYVPQDTFILDDTIRRNVAFGINDEDIADERVWASLRAASLGQLVETMPDGLNTRLGERGGRLSGGERQRFGIARALYCGTPIIVFDEPTSALDATTEFEITKVINSLRGEKTIIIIAHRLSTLTRCDRVLYFESGRVIAEGTFNKLMSTVPKFREMAEHLKIAGSPEAAENAAT